MPQQWAPVRRQGQEQERPVRQEQGWMLPGRVASRWRGRMQAQKRERLELCRFLAWSLL